MDVQGLALGRSIGNFIQAALLVLVLVVFMKKHLHAKEMPLAPVFDILKIAGLCAVIFLLCLAIQTCFNPLANFKLNAIVKLSVSAILLVPVYFFLAHSLKIPDSSLVSFRKKRKVEIDLPGNRSK
jgi:peptidoglycan biosynthesis protein MviN/MurJ (putative lipid II flippase)